MGREKWNLIRQSKGFYIRNFRWAESALFFSFAISVLLLLAISHVYFSHHQPDYYATDGITPPKKLKALNEPNYTDVPLLSNDIAVDTINRSIPQ